MASKSVFSRPIDTMPPSWMSIIGWVAADWKLQQSGLQERIIVYSVFNKIKIKQKSHLEFYVLLTHLYG